MRMSFEVISGEAAHREFPNRKTGEIERVPLMALHGVDSDFPNVMYKVQIWREFEKVQPHIVRGTVLEVKFNSLKPADGRFEKVPVISTNQDNIRVLKSAEQALNELRSSIAGNNRSQATAAPAETA